MKWLKKLFWRIFPPIEVSATRNLADAFFSDCSFLTSPTLKNIVFSQINDFERTLYTIRCLHKTPDQLVLLLVNNVSGKLLQSGQYHTYRGVLSFQGKELLKAFKLSVKLLEAKDYYTEDDALEDYDWIRRQISDAG